MAESVLTPIPDIRSAFSARKAGEQEDWPDRMVTANFALSDLQEWLGWHGYPGGKDVANATITSRAGGPLFLALKTWYRMPVPDGGVPIGGKFFLLEEDGDDEVAHEHRLTLLLGFPKTPMSKPHLGWTDLKQWLEPYGIGDRICKPVVGDYRGFTVTEWRLEDGRFGQQITRIEMAA